MKHYLIKILRQGDTVLSVQDFQIVVRRANTEVDIVGFSFDENGLPRINMDQMTTITFGDSTTEVTESSPAKSRASRKTSSSGKKTQPHPQNVGETIVGTF